MYKSYFLNIGIILSSLLFLSSCADKSIVDFKDNSSYIDYLKGKSEGDLKIALAKDAAYLTKRIDSVKDIVFYEDFSLSPTDEEENDKPNLVSAKAFSLLAADNIKEAFESYNHTLKYTQKYAIPKSEFNFSSEEDSDFLLDSNLSSTIKNAYFGKNKLGIKDIKLNTPDSLSVQTSYTYPTKFETVTVDRNAKKVRFRDFEIEIDTIYKSIVHLSLPGNLAPKILRCQAVDKRKVLMDSHGYYSYPNKALSTETLTALNLFRTILANAAKTIGKENIVIALEKIPKDSFELLAKVNSFNEDIIKVDENGEDGEVMGQMNRINEKYKTILGVKKQQIKMYFDNDVEKLQIYIETESNKITANSTAKAKDDNESSYRVFVQRDIEKYGIVDKKGNIIIKAEYNTLLDKGNSYFEEEIPNARKGQTYYLDGANRKLVKVPEGLLFRHRYNAEYAVFENENRQVGILKNNTKTIVPIAYLNIAKKDNIFMAYNIER